MDSSRIKTRMRERGDRPREISPYLTAWGAPFVSGLLVAAVGLVAFWFPVISGVASAVFLGVMLAIAGVIELIGAIRHRKDRSAVLPILSGLLSIVVGILFITQPLLGVAALGLLVAAYFFATGLFRGITSVIDRYPRWGWDFAYGVIAVAAGAVLLLNWPASSLVLIGLLVGIELIARGAALMAVAWRIRRFTHHGFGESHREAHEAPASV
ncbi:MAG TPA: HdeD family acid-resistance protein [Polyangiaceae bacterium]